MHQIAPESTEECRSWCGEQHILEFGGWRFVCELDDERVSESSLPSQRPRADNFEMFDRVGCSCGCAV